MAVALHQMAGDASGRQHYEQSTSPRSPECRIDPQELQHILHDLVLENKYPSGCGSKPGSRQSSCSRKEHVPGDGNLSGSTSSGESDISGASYDCSETSCESKNLRQIDLDEECTDSQPEDLLVRRECDTIFFETTFHRYTTASNVGVIFDWDDTLCPTSWLREDVGLEEAVALSDLPAGQRNTLVKELMETHVRYAREALLEAHKHGVVVILTLASRSWLHDTLQNWMPELLSTVKECDVRFLYAKDFLTEDDRVIVEAAASVAKIKHIWTKAKELALLDFLQRSHVNWTDVVSIGDSEFERLGVQEAVKNLNLSCRTKTLKLMDDPTVEELSAQLIMVRHWMQSLIERLDDFDNSIDAPEDEDLWALHEEITGEADESLSWLYLTGLR
jgi:hypothetical protein